jgi:hypothetical protein
MSQKDFRTHYRERNPYTFESHRRQVFWQIYFPLIAFLMLILVGVVLVLIAPPGQASLYADIALIYIIVILMVVGVIIITLLSASIFGVRQVLKPLPFYMFRAQDFFIRIKRRVVSISNGSVEPILRIRSATEGARTLGRSFKQK